MFWKTLVTATLGIVLSGLPALAEGGIGPGGYGGYHMGGSGWHGWFLGPLTMILVVVGIVAVVVWLMRSSGAAQPAPRQGRDPIDILKERFAKGEIDKAEYEERKATLDS